MHRGWMDSDVWDKQPYGEREAFEWLIGEARWKPGMTNIGGRPVPLKRGQCSHSLRFMADKFQWSKKKVECFIEKMKLWGMIKTDKGTGQNIITICNYETYQNNGDAQGDSQGDSEGTAGGQQGDKQEEGSKKGKKVTKNLAAPKIEKPTDVSESVWEDFKTHRKTKKAGITETGIDGIRKEAAIAGISLEEAMREMCSRGWQGFKAEWLKKDKQGTQNAPRTGNHKSAVDAMFAGFVAAVDNNAV